MLIGKYHEIPIGPIALSRHQESSVLNKGEDKGITPTIEGKVAIVHCSAPESTSVIRGQNSPIEGRSY